VVGDTPAGGLRVLKGSRWRGRASEGRPAAGARVWMGGPAAGVRVWGGPAAGARVWRGDGGDHGWPGRRATYGGGANGQNGNGEKRPIFLSSLTKTFQFWACDEGCGLSHVRFLDASIKLISLIS
jgi:hypothetical protein